LRCRTGRAGCAALHRDVENAWLADLTEAGPMDESFVARRNAAGNLERRPEAAIRIATLRRGADGASALLGRPRIASLQLPRQPQA
jgi:hypothetical protein